MTTPTRGQPSSSILVASTSTGVTNASSLVIRLSYPNGTVVSSGMMFAGSMQSVTVANHYVFNNTSPGTYALNITGVKGIYLPPTSVKVFSGLNNLNITVYQLSTFVLVQFPNLSFNGTQPGPEIKVPNGTAVRFVVINNTTLIQNVAVTRTLYNSSFSNVLFNSLSDTLSAGGTVNATFIVSETGLFYYQCLIGNDARVGEYGYFEIL